MTDYVIPAPPIVGVPVQGGGLFPVRRIFCVGRNYAAHVREMGGDPNRETPFFFTKPADALVAGGADMPYPTMTQDLHHEMEMVVAIGQGGRGIAESVALQHVFGYAAGLDMTRRDLQAEAKKHGRPWDMAKGFDHSAPIGDIVPAAIAGHPDQGLIELRVNGNVRQSSDLAKMIWSVPETIAYLSRLVVLAPGDLIFSGTPDGVAAVAKGDVLAGQIAGIGTVRTRIV
ncbi:fumarylacetoacetate hydrolase family protein [Methylovirgula sp. 4M-Z18]|uniref:fumarylacetoacetate hydrolase family protein n=1 Tax=Methylovirgula sp. 4M-Z18 TaxID=2293567 RepID=UPI000E2F1E64|nr:fumarylacetoacetate hydrolase family protein [Methylovirgula sp. 4M-Z18]RFB79028.1 FAA hydrolase family protein [Methylovirgula sp. 4M-Z18]